MVPKSTGLSPFLTKVTLVGGGELTEATVSDLLTRAPNLVACDGAARRVLTMGHRPRYVIGDLDSLDNDTRAALDPSTIVRIDEQESTDFEKALSCIDAPLVLGAGFMGRRLDHELACYNALVRRPERACILVGAHDICFHLARSTTLHLPPGSRVSLFPMAEVTVNATGLRWPLDDLVLSPWGRVGTSNAAVDPKVTIESDGRGLLVILPRAALDAAIAALTPAGS